MPFGVKIEKSEDVKKITQVAIKALTNTVKTLLGPNHTLKCIIDDEIEAQIVGDASTLLRALRIRNPFLKVLKKICSSQHRELGTVIIN